MSKLESSLEPSLTPAIHERESRRLEKVLKRPFFYVVIVHHDPVTPRTFAADVLRRFFAKAESEATTIIGLARDHGAVPVAKYARDIAESKVRQVNDHCRTAGYPLFFSFDRE